MIHLIEYTQHILYMYYKEAPLIIYMKCIYVTNGT
jgi:hypothetical protein